MNEEKFKRLEELLGIIEYQPISENVTQEDEQVLLIIESLKVNEPKNYKLYSRKYIQMDYRRMQVFNSKLG